MSEADSPNDQPVTDPITPSDYGMQTVTSEAVDAMDGDGWQTVDFPGAMSVDALLQNQAMPPKPLEAFGEGIETGVIHYSTAEINPEMTNLVAFPSEKPDAVVQLQQLEAENAELRDRLRQAELDLVQHQIEWQLESASAQTEAAQSEPVEMSPAAGAEQAISFDPTSDSLTQIRQELERAQQTAQRQQILVETLTEQLESSQERIAQLERDCALTQQRYNEQVQQVLQVEGICRDLRLRLHRQQQQTLQFKAALEKCLEMPTAYEQQVLPAIAPDDSSAPQALSALLQPKNQPVKPWSLPSNQTQVGASDQAEVFNPLFKLLNADGLEPSPVDLRQEDALLSAFNSTPGRDNEGHAIASSTDPSALLDSDDPQFVTQLMQLIFPAAAGPLVHENTEALEADVSHTGNVFDLNPFLNADRAKAETLSLTGESSQASIVSDPEGEELVRLPALTGSDVPLALNVTPSDVEASVPISISPPPVATDPLWQDLAALIDPPVTDSPAIVDRHETVDSPETTAAPLAQARATSDRGGIPPIFASSHLITTDRVPSKAHTEPTTPSLSTWTWRDRLHRSSKSSPRSNVERTTANTPEAAEQNSSKLPALGSAERHTAVTQAAIPQTVNASSQIKLTSAPFSTTMPSPIVYPLRSSKKLASLAAVDLPTFPRR